MVCSHIGSRGAKTKRRGEASLHSVIERGGIRMERQERMPVVERGE